MDCIKRKLLQVLKNFLEILKRVWMKVFTPQVFFCWYIFLFSCNHFLSPNRCLCRGTAPEKHTHRYQCWALHAMPHVFKYTVRLHTAACLMLNANISVFSSFSLSLSFPQRKGTILNRSSVHHSPSAIWLSTNSHL